MQGKTTQTIFILHVLSICGNITFSFIPVDGCLTTEVTIMANLFA